MIVICGPCVVEDRGIMLEIGSHIRNTLDKINGNFDVYFKSSCIKDNRTKLGNYYGPGFARGLELLTEIKEFYSFKIVTDFHTPQQIKEFHRYVDMIQIPAYLAMQTELLRSAVESNKLLHIKKPQFLNPQLINNIVSKVFGLGYDKELLVTDRGMCFGFDYLVMDPRCINLMRKQVNLEHPDKIVKFIVDCTHPNKFWNDRNYCFDLAKSYTAIGIDGLFIETHPFPSIAKCDSDNQLSLDSLKDLFDQVNKIKC